MFEQMVNSFTHHKFDPGNSNDLGTILEVSEQMYINSTLPIKLKSKSPMTQNGISRVSSSSQSSKLSSRKNGHIRHSNSLVDLKSLYNGAYHNEDEAGSTSDSELVKSETKSVQSRRRRTSILTSFTDQSTNSVPTVTIKSKSKKKVCFADEKGHRLVKVKVMTESSDTPPFLNPSVFNELEDKSSEAPSIREWKLHFCQPASQYLLLREKVERFMVSLENVIVEQCTDYISGTVKVKNVGFEKEVFLRVSFDKWSSHTDVHCRYLASSNSSILSTDTFTFRFSVPQNLTEFDGEQRVEFCVCFRCNNSEFWDNNNSLNYLLTCKIDQNKQRNDITSHNSGFTTDYRPNFDKYSDFTTYRAWKHFDEELRYY